MEYKNLHQPKNLKGMVKVLPDSFPSQLLSPQRKQNNEFQRNFPVLSFSSLPLQSQRPTSEIYVPRLPPPPKNPRPPSFIRQQNSSLIEPRKGDSIFPQQSQEKFQVFTKQIQSYEPPPLANSVFSQQPQPPKIVSNQNLLTQKPQPEAQKGFRGDMKTLHDEIASLKREIESMNQPMKEHDEWLMLQSQQLNELVKQQKQLETNMKLSPPIKRTQITINPSRQPPPLPTSPKPKLVSQVILQSQQSSQMNKLNTVKSNSNNFQSTFNGNSELVRSKSSINLSYQSELDRLNRNREVNKKISNENNLSKPEYHREEVKAYSSANVRRISDLFENSGKNAETKNLLLKSHQSRSLGLSEKINQLSPSLSVGNLMDIQSENGERDLIRGIPTSKPLVSSKPNGLSSPKPVQVEFSSISTKNSILTVPPVTRNDQKKTPSTVDEETSFNSETSLATNDATLSSTPAPTPPPMPPASKPRYENLPLLSSNNYDDKVSISSGMSSSSTYSLPRNLDSSDLNNNGSKAELMEQIRQFGQGESKLKKATSVEDDKSTCRQQNPMHDALQNRFKAIYGGNESDSGEGDSYSDADDNSDDWED